MRQRALVPLLVLFTLFLGPAAASFAAPQDVSPPPVETPEAEVPPGETDAVGQGATYKAEWELDDAGEASNALRVNDPAKAVELIDRAIEAWQRRSEMVEELNGLGIIDYWHIRNDVDRDYGYDPSAKLRQLKNMVSKQG